MPPWLKSAKSSLFISKIKEQFRVNCSFCIMIENVWHNRICGIILLLRYGC